MTESEAVEVLAYLRGTWPNRPEVEPELEARIWARRLAAHSQKSVLAAIDTFRGPFCPGLMEILNVLEPPPEPVTINAVLAEFKRMNSKSDARGPVPSVTEWRDPAIWAFAKAGRWNEWADSPDSTYYPERASAEAAFRAQLRDAWQASEPRMRREGVAALEAARAAAAALEAGATTTELPEEEE